MKTRIYIDDDGFDCANAFTAMAIGSGSCVLGRKTALGVIDNSGRLSVAADAVCAGATAAGSDIWNIGECTLPSLSFSIKSASLDNGIFITNPPSPKIIILDKNGCRINGSQERNIAEFAVNSENIMFSDFIGGKVNASGFIMQYREYIRKNIPEKLNLCIEISTHNKILYSLCKEIIPYRRDIGKCVIFQISSDGTRTSLYSDETGFVFYEKLCLVCYKYLMEQGISPIALYDFPGVLDKLAENYNMTPQRVHQIDNPCFEFLNDALLLVMKIAEIISENNLPLEKLTDGIPDFAISSRYISTNCNFCDIEKYLEIHNNIYNNARMGRAVIKPSKSGLGIYVRAESSMSETAGELCGFIEDKIKHIGK